MHPSLLITCYLRCPVPPFWSAFHPSHPPVDPLIIDPHVVCIYCSSPPPVSSVCQLHPEPAAQPLWLFQSDLGMRCCLDFLESLNATLPVSGGGHTQTWPVIRNIKYSLLEHRQICLVAMQRKWQGWPKMTGNIKHWKERLKLEDKPFAVGSSRAFYIFFCAQEVFVHFLHVSHWSGQQGSFTEQSKQKTHPKSSPPTHTFFWLMWIIRKRTQKPLASRSSEENCKNRLCMKVIGDILPLLRVGWGLWEI